MSFPASVHSDQLNAFNDLLSKAASAGYTAVDTDLGEKGLVASILANLMKDVVTDSITGLTSNNTLVVTAPGTVGAVNIIGTNGVLLNAGTAIKGIRIISQSLTPAPISAAVAAVQEQLFTTGALSNITTSDVIFANFAALGGTLVGTSGYRVAGNGTIGISFVCGITTQTPTGGLATIFALRS